MYLAVDIGGTKVLMASFDEASGEPVQKITFPTPSVYNDFLQEFHQVAQKLGGTFTAVGIGAPGNSARATRETVHFGPNLPWKQVLLKNDVSRLLDCPVFLENDAKVGALSEYNYIKNDFSRFLYVVLGTGIGLCLITNGVIDTNYGDGGGDDIIVNVDGQRTNWEKQISGSAITRRFGKRASDITDEATWKIIAHDLSLGLAQLIQDQKPQVVVISGGAGKHFERYGEMLKTNLRAALGENIPAILPARHPEEAVIYGCIELMKQTNG